MTTLRPLSAIWLVLVLTLAGCAQAATNPPEPESSATPKEKQEESSPEACDSVTQGSIEVTVNAQTSAFASGDFKLAYSFASPNFRTNVTLDAFTEIIAGSYGPLIGSSQLNFRDCVVDINAGLALIDVRFTQAGNDVYALRYVMIQSDQGWRVEGASNLEVVGKGT